MGDKAALAAKYQLSSVIQEIKTVLNTARRKAASQINRELLNTYWQIGQIICEYEQSQPERADYGKQTLERAFQSADQRIRQRILPLQSSKYARPSI